MKRSKKLIAMLLAGGQGSRLLSLTTKVAKPAVSFGGKYRIIDFPLSNCTNSKIDTVGVLTQYQPLILNEYIGSGTPWDLDRTYGGVHILPPYQAKDSSAWYLGTANAIYQNINFIKNYNPEHVLILSGDHIYKMDYYDMLNYHIEKGADCTIATLEVTMEEASRFGIMNTDKNMKIDEFEEKPKVPKNNQASMGIYIFKTDKLIEYLEADNELDTNHDFGKDIIPTMLKNGEKLFAYPFKGYWKDVGTIESLWLANMDLLGDKPRFDLYDKSWKIYSRITGFTPQYIGESSYVDNSLISGGCYINGKVINSVIGSNVVIKSGAVVENCVIFNNVVIENNAEVFYSILDEDVKVGSGAIVGEKDAGSKKITVVGREYEVGKNQVIKSGQNIEKEGK